MFSNFYGTVSPVLNAFSTCARFWHKSKILPRCFGRTDNFRLVPNIWHKSRDAALAGKQYDWRNRQSPQLRPHAMYSCERWRMCHSVSARSSNQIFLFVFIVFEFSICVRKSRSTCAKSLAQVKNHGKTSRSSTCARIWHKSWSRRDWGFVVAFRFVGLLGFRVSACGSE